MLTKGAAECRLPLHNLYLTTEHILDLPVGVGFTEGGKPENPEKNPESTGKTNYNNSTRTSLRINTRLYPGGHPSSYCITQPHPTGFKFQTQW